MAINLAAAAVAEMTERQTKFRRRDVNDAENQTRAISHPFNIDTALPVIAAAPQVRHVYSSVRPKQKNLKLRRSGTSWNGITCRPYRAEAWNGFQAINISRLWRFDLQLHER